MAERAPNQSSSTSHNTSGSPAHSANSQYQRPRFNVVLDGNTAPGVAVNEVATQLAKLARTSPKHARQLLAGKATTIKSNVAPDVAQRCLMTLLEIGAIAHIVPITATADSKKEVSQSVESAINTSKHSETSTTEIAAKLKDNLSTQHHDLKAEPNFVKASYTGEKQASTSTPLTPAATTAIRHTRSTLSETPKSQINTDSEKTHLSSDTIRNAINTTVVRGNHRRVIDLIALYVVTLGALSLPFIYLASLMTLALALQWHVHTNTDWLWAATSPITSILYIAPIFAGSILLLLMAKPIIAPSEPGDQSIPVDFVKDAVVVALVERVAAATGARAPFEIRLSWQATIVTESRPGIMRYIWNRPIVTLGLPLIGELKTRQLVHLLATELVRYSHHHSFALLRLLEQVHVFLYHAAYEEDLWDIKLDQLIQRSTDFKVIALIGIKGLIAATRLPMAFLSQICQLLTVRQLTSSALDADRYASCLAGSEDARSALTRQFFLNAAEKIIVDDIYHAIQTGKRVENIPDAILRKAKSLPVHIINQIRRAANRPNRGVMGVYPSLAARITALSVLPATASITLTNAAIDLLPRYRELSSQLSQLFYTQLGLNPASVHRQASQTLSNQQDEYEKSLINRYFRGNFRNDRILVPNVPTYTVPSATLGLANSIRAVIRDMRGARHSTTQDANHQKTNDTLEQLAIRRLGLVLQARLNYGDNQVRRAILAQIDSLKALEVAQPALDRLLRCAQALHNHPQKHNASHLEVRNLLKWCRDSYAALLGLLVKGTYPFYGGNNPTHVLSYFQHSAGAPDVMTESVDRCLASASAVTLNIRSLHRGIITTLIEMANETEKQLGVAHGHSAPVPVSNSTIDTSTGMLGAQA